MLCTIFFYTILLVVNIYLIIFHTPLGIYVFRNQMFRPFSQKVKLPSGLTANLSEPVIYGFQNASNLYIQTTYGFLGAWYVKPPDSNRPCLTTVLYLHGRSQNRGYDHRVGLYHVLLNSGMCVLTVDYRGFADSSPVEIHEDTVVEDALAAYRYLRKRYEPQKILVWGHSLGAPIAARLVAQHLSLEMGQQKLVLESAFSNMKDLVDYGDWPWWQKLVTGMIGLKAADVEFR